MGKSWCYMLHRAFGKPGGSFGEGPCGGFNPDWRTFVRLGVKLPALAPIAHSGPLRVGSVLSPTTRIGAAYKSVYIYTALP